MYIFLKNLSSSFDDKFKNKCISFSPEHGVHCVQVVSVCRSYSCMPTFQVYMLRLSSVVFTTIRRRHRQEIEDASDVDSCE